MPSMPQRANLGALPDLGASSDTAELKAVESRLCPDNSRPGYLSHSPPIERRGRNVPVFPLVDCRRDCRVSRHRDHLV